MHNLSTTPTISVIVPVYNAEKYLPRCIESVLAQTFVDWEMLLIDDGSTDASGSICDEYAAKDERIRVFHKENGGVSSARNLGLDNAQGEWITFVDSDDYIEENYLKSFEGNLDADLVVGNIQMIRKQEVEEVGSHISPGYYNDIKSEVANCLTNLCFLAPWGKMFRRTLVLGLHFDESMCISEDTKYVFSFISRSRSLRVLANSAIKNCLYVYIVPSQSTDAKYQISVESSVHHLLSLEKTYQSIGVRDKGFEVFNVQAFYERCMNDLPKRGYLWYKNKDVERLCLRRSANLGIFAWVKTWLSFHLFYRLKMHQANKHKY